MCRAGWLEQPTLHVSAMGVMLQVSGLAYMLPMVSGMGPGLRLGRDCGQARCCALRPLCMGRSRSGLMALLEGTARPPAALPADALLLLLTAPTSHPLPPQGLSCATSVRVSNALGAGLPHGARRSANTATACTACTQLLLVAAILLGRHGIGALFTNIPEVVAMCAATFPLMSASMFGDGLNCTISGVLRGAGRQELGALLNLGSYWGLGLPTAYLLAVKGGLELKGLWGGLILATSVQVRAAGRAQIMLLYWTPGRLPSCAAPPGSCSMLAALLLGALSDFHPACVAAPPCRAPSCSSS